MNEAYHETINHTSGNPYAIVPPVGQLLAVICADLSVGGCFRPGNRELARRMCYTSAGSIPGLIAQLVCDGWIAYDHDSGVITLLRSITISDRDRDLPHSDATDHSSGSPKTDESACMVLTATAGSTESDSESDVAVVVRGGVGGDRPSDRRPTTAQLMAEFGANPKIIREAFASRPDWTPGQVRDRWEYDQRRIAASDGRLTTGVFFTALRSGEVAPERPPLDRPLDPQSYAGRDGFALGGAPPPPEDAPESWADRAWRILPEGSPMADCIYVQTWLARGKSDAAALQALASRRARR